MILWLHSGLKSFCTHSLWLPQRCAWTEIDQLAIASFTHYASDTTGECLFIWFLLVCICSYYKFHVFLAPFHLFSFQHCLKPPVVERWLPKAVAIISLFKQGDGHWKTNNPLDGCFQSVCYIKDDWVSLELYSSWDLRTTWEGCCWLLDRDVSLCWCTVVLTCEFKWFHSQASLLERLC